MFIYQTFERFIYPVSLTFLLLVAALALMKYRRAHKLLLILALVALGIGGNGWVSGWLVRSLEWDYLPRGELPKADAIVTLSGGIYPKQYPRKTVEMGNQADRLLYAGWLYKQGKAPLIICTGGIVPGSTRENAISEDMLTMLEMVGIPKEAVVLETKARNTYEHLKYCSKIFERRKIKKILLVTSALHMPRAMAVFRKSNLEVIPAPTDFMATRSERKPPFIRRVFKIFPSAGGLSSTRAAMHEYIGLCYYKVRGWI